MKLKTIFISDLDKFVERTHGWTQLVVLDVYAPLKFSLVIYKTFLKDVYVCSKPTFVYHRWLWFGLDVYEKEEPSTSEFHNRFAA